jgi:hypothetical protein
MYGLFSKLVYLFGQASFFVQEEDSSLPRIPLN